MTATFHTRGFVKLVLLRIHHDVRTAIELFDVIVPHVEGDARGQRESEFLAFPLDGFDVVARLILGAFDEQDNELISPETIEEDSGITV